MRLLIGVELAPGSIDYLQDHFRPERVLRHADAVIFQQGRQAHIQRRQLFRTRQLQRTASAADRQFLVHLFVRYQRQCHILGNGIGFQALLQYLDFLAKSGLHAAGGQIIEGIAIVL